MQKNIIYVNKTMVLFQLPPCVFPPTIIIKDGKTPTYFFPADALNFVCLVLMPNT